MITSILSAANVVMAAVPDPGAGVAPPGSANVIKVLGWVAWIVFIAITAGILIAAGTMAHAADGHSTNNPGNKKLMYAVLAAIVAGSAAAIITAVS